MAGPKRLIYGRSTDGSEVPIHVTTARHQVVAGGQFATMTDGVANNFIKPRDEIGSARDFFGLAANYAFCGAGVWDRVRTPDVFKTVDLSASSSAQDIWEPSTGKKFRLMGFVLTPTAPTKITLFDDSTGTPTFVTRTALDTPVTPPSMGNGILSGAANNVLKILAAATSAAMQGTVWGTEE